MSTKRYTNRWAKRLILHAWSMGWIGLALLGFFASSLWATSGQMGELHHWLLGIIAFCLVAVLATTWGAGRVEGKLLRARAKAVATELARRQAEAARQLEQLASMIPVRSVAPTAPAYEEPEPAWNPQPTPAPVPAAPPATFVAPTEAAPAAAELETTTVGK